MREIVIQATDKNKQFHKYLQLSDLRLIIFFCSSPNNDLMILFYIILIWLVASCGHSTTTLSERTNHLTKNE